MRKIAENDLNRLQRALLRGDPLVAFLRDAWQRSQGQLPPPAVQTLVSERSEDVMWLREQFERGALPKDPVLIASLLEQARRDPDLVTRLVADLAEAGCVAGAEACDIPPGISE